MIEIIHKIFEAIGFLSVCSFIAIIGIGVLNRSDTEMTKDEDIDDEV